MNSTNTLSISELRANTAQAIDNVSNKKEPTVILQRSEPKAVLVDIDYFNALEEAVLDLTDAQEAEKAKKEKKISLKIYLKKRWGKSDL
ncbi:MAG: Prevent-host-death family protein [Candidatus Gottesmanbacteria bacterium GW2011_GWA2_41_12]|uniref:Antitoxin n=2 Tax=Candidatus Gottesmaniibacteriota TaxID=1752720 RepID=A0A0G0UI95_9BACT|nr:MAG: Prevent-host-death family protein [Candidatus Gottesmanbacteria bacterium GW2011_GWC2_39_8]KKR88544.1 MAG: Prevent-host-death family protein [Candidatus Gottesmanbacteria bacterium GW2011_GWA2_41_12]